MYDKEIRLLKGLKCGYLQFRDHSHPLAYGDGSIYYHRHLASIKIGRWLYSSEHVHHIDENKLNNSLENLKVLTASEHSKLHNPQTDFGHDDRTLESYTCVNCTGEFHPLRASKTKQYCSQDCFKAATVKDKEITKELLDSLIPITSWKDLGKMFNYSDVGIRKRAKALGCNIPTRKRPSS